MMFAVAALGASQPAPQAIRFGVAFDDGGSPVADGRETSLGAVAGQVPFTVYLPEVAAASDASVAHVWVRTTWLPEVYIEYRSGVIVIERAPQIDQAAFFREETQAGYANVSTLDGLPVLIHAANDKGSSGSVQFTVGGTSVQVIGDLSVPASSLSDAASSIIGSAGS